MFYTDAVTRDCGSSGVLDNGVTTWMYAKLYSRQRIVGVQLLPVYNKITGTSMFKVNLLTAMST